LPTFQSKLLVVDFGHDAEGHERLLTGVEVEDQKAVGRVYPVSALKSRWPIWMVLKFERLQLSLTKFACAA
jgi:hypothetical protein